MPKYKLEAEVKNTKSKEGGNLLSFKIVVTRGDPNSNGNQKELGFLHSNTYTDYYVEEVMIVIVDKDKNRMNHYEKIKFGYLNEMKSIEYNMLGENNGKNNFGVYLLSLNYPGIEMSQDLSIKIDENNLMNNFIENRKKEILTQEEFEKKYGIKNYKNNINDKKKHQN